MQRRLLKFLFCSKSYAAKSEQHRDWFLLKLPLKDRRLHRHSVTGEEATQSHILDDTFWFTAYAVQLNLINQIWFLHINALQHMEVFMTAQCAVIQHATGRFRVNHKSWQPLTGDKVPRGPKFRPNIFHSKRRSASQRWGNRQGKQKIFCFVATNTQMWNKIKLT